MISLEHILEKREDFGVRCYTKEEVATLVEYIYYTHPEKRNENVNVFCAWDHFKEDTIIYPNFWNCNKLTFGRVGGKPSFKRPIYEFFELNVPSFDLPIEQSDMDISFMLGL